MSDSNLDALLAPLPENIPCGKPVRYEPVYDQIMAARTEDDPNLPQGVWETSLKRADWKQVITLATDVLQHQSKDLHVAAALGEAWIATQGLAGALDAVRLMSGLCADYWQHLHPLPQDGDMDYRLAPLEWADRIWSDALSRRAPVLPSSQGQRAYTLTDWKVALDAERQSGKTRDSDAPLPSASYSDIIEQLGTQAYATLQALIQTQEATLAALTALRQCLAEFVGANAPRFGQTAQMLDAIGDMLGACARQHPHFDPQAASADSAAQPGNLTPVASNNASAMELDAFKISSREDAYRKLSHIANYLANIEPHSPVPTLIRRAVTWGHMPFDELMRELMQNNGEIQRMLLK